MNSVFYLTVLLIAFCSATKQHYNTNNRQIYASWGVCDSCNCHYFSLYAFEQATQNPADTTPPVYLYYTHEDYNQCTYTYQSQWLQMTNSVPGLEISRSGRSAELVTTNQIDSSNRNVSISLSWSSVDSQNTNNCNCQNIYSYGTQSFRIQSQSNYRISEVVGSVIIDSIIYTVPTDAYGYIAGYGQKTLVLEHQ